MKLSEKSAYINGLMGRVCSCPPRRTRARCFTLWWICWQIWPRRSRRWKKTLSLFLTEKLDEIEEVLDSLEDCMDELFDDDDLYDFDDEDEDDDDYDFDDENPEYEVTCPIRGEVVVVDENTLLAGETSCPKCGESLEFEFDEIEP